jgi:hypothetical protein
MGIVYPVTLADVLILACQHSIGLFLSNPPEFNIKSAIHRVSGKIFADHCREGFSRNA